MNGLRAAAFYAGQALCTLVFCLLSLLVAPLPFQARYAVVSRWAHICLWWLERTCGLDFRVTGQERIPPGPAIVLCKHQSAWETLALQRIFPPQVWVLKRELLWIPLFGWGLATLRPIAIDRKAGRVAMQQVVEQGRERLASGCWVVIFPEGTRVAPGARRRYGIGGGLLAERTGAPVVPVAHNAGLFWPRKGFRKRPGTIDVVIGPTIEARGKTAQQITAEAQTWIEAESDRLLAVAGRPPGGGDRPTVAP